MDRRGRGATVWGRLAQTAGGRLPGHWGKFVTSRRMA